jgi:hypothetical protein
MWWWEITIVIRKVALVVVGGVFGSKLGPDMQVYMALFLVVVFIVVHLAAIPFDELTPAHKILHWLELGALLVCWGTLYSGMLFWLGSTSAGRLGPEFLTLLSVTIILGNLLFTVCLLFVFVRAITRESKTDGEHSEEALRKRMQVRSAGPGSSRPGTQAKIKKPGARKTVGKRIVKVSPQKSKNRLIERTSFSRSITNKNTWHEQMRRKEIVDKLRGNTNQLNANGLTFVNKVITADKARAAQITHTQSKARIVKKIKKQKDAASQRLNSRLLTRQKSKKMKGKGSSVVGRAAYGTEI